MTSERERFQAFNQSALRPAAIGITLAALVLIYLLAFDLRLHLDKGLVVHDTGLSVWDTMRKHLPDVRFQSVAQILFGLAGVVVVLGSVVLTIMAIEAGDQDLDPQPETLVTIE